MECAKGTIVRSMRDWFSLRCEREMCADILNGNVAADVDGSMRLRGSRLREGNFTYFRVDDVNINLDIGGISVHFENLFNGDRELGSYIKVASLLKRNCKKDASREASN